MEETRKSTKDRILGMLKKEVSLPVTTLTERLGITHMAVRKHLISLENDGLVTSREMRQQMGRPLQIYSLTGEGEKLFPRNYEGITLEFLKDIEEMFGESAVNDLFLKREERLAGEYSRKIGSKPNADKIKELVSIQNEKGYMASASLVGDNLYELVEYNCPILSVAASYKTACKCETQMLKKVLNTEKVNRTSCKTDSDSHCKFLIDFN